MDLDYVAITPILDNVETPESTEFSVINGNFAALVNGVPLTAKVTISAAEIQATTNSSGPLVLAGVPGKTIVPISSYTYFHYNTTAYVGSEFYFYLGTPSQNSGEGYGNWEVIYGNIPTADSVALGSNYFSYMIPASSPGDSLYLYNYEGPLTTGDGTMDINLMYWLL